MQQDLDAGLQYCTACGVFGWHTFCGQCGRRFVGHELMRWRCPNEDCHAEVTSDYCPLCGTLARSDFMRRLKEGKVDWRAEGRTAGETLRRILHHNPKLIPELVDESDVLSGPMDVAGAVRAVWGERR